MVVENGKQQQITATKPRLRLFAFNRFLCAGSSFVYSKPHRRQNPKLDDLTKFPFVTKLPRGYIFMYLITNDTTRNSICYPKTVNVQQRQCWGNTESLFFTHSLFRVFLQCMGAVRYTCLPNLLYVYWYTLSCKVKKLLSIVFDCETMYLLSSATQIAGALMRKESLLLALSVVYLETQQGPESQGLHLTQQEKATQL